MADLIGLRIAGKIDDKRAAGSWPFDNVLTVSQTDTAADYATIPTAITAASAGDVILLDSETFTITVALALNKAITIIGHPGGTIIADATNDTNIIDISAAASVRNLTLNHTGAGTSCKAITCSVSGVTLQDLFINMTGAPGSNMAIYHTGGNTTPLKVIDCFIAATGGLSGYGYINETASAKVEFYGGSLNGSYQDIYGDQTGSSISIYGATLVNNRIFYSGAIERSGNVSFERARPNPLINGSFLIWQRGTSFAAVASGQYTADRWVYDKTGAMVHTITRDTSVPTVAQAGMLVPYSVKLDVTTVDSSISSGDLCLFGQNIEGYNWLHLAQRQFTVSFWVRDTKTGIHCISFVNSGADRSYVAEYTIASADTWEYKTVTVPASPSAGTWDYTTGIGLRVNWALAVGSTYQTTAGAWQTGNFFGTSGQVNAVDNTANNFQLALVKIEPGSVATPFVMPDYELEYGRCLRYAYVVDVSAATNIGQGAKISTTQVAILLQFPRIMRTTPTLTHNISGYTAGVPATTSSALINYAVNNFYNITGSLTVALANANRTYGSLTFTAGTSWDGTAGNISTMRLGPDVVAVLSSEL